MPIFVMMAYSVFLNFKTFVFWKEDQRLNLGKSRVIWTLKAWLDACPYKPWWANTSPFTVFEQWLAEAQRGIYTFETLC